MNTFLNKIITTKKEEIERLKKSETEQTLSHKIEWSLTPHYPFANAIRTQKHRLSLIAEVKKASPSKGIIREDFNPVQIAKDFENQNAICISVLTETDYFLGHPSYIAAIKEHIKKPILRKDFIIDPIQVWESKALGADAILLIKALLSREECAQFISLAHKLHLTVLLEVHNEAELRDCEGLNPDLIGVNNRNLDTFEVDTNTAIILRPLIQSLFPTALIIAESGYSKNTELDNLQTEKFDAVLIGEGLATHPDLINYWNKR